MEHEKSLEEVLQQLQTGIKSPLLMHAVSDKRLCFWPLIFGHLPHAAHALLWKEYQGYHTHVSGNNWEWSGGVPGPLNNAVTNFCCILNCFKWTMGIQCIPGVSVHTGPYHVVMTHIWFLCSWVSTECVYQLLVMLPGIYRIFVHSFV